MNSQLSPEGVAFLAEANLGIAKAQAASFAAGVPIIYKDAAGRYVEEHPEGRIFEIRFRPGETGDRHVEVLRELPGRAH